MLKDRYLYPAVFHYNYDGISVEFPDLPGCLTSATTAEEAVHMAKEALALHLFGLEEEGEAIPSPSALTSLINDPKVPSVILIDVWMPPFRDYMKERSVKKTLTIPKWLDDVARENKVNYSYVLKEALMDYLDLGTEDPDDES